MKITLWDEDALRLQASAANLKEAARKLQIKVNILCQSEPPLLSRMGLTGTTPVVELNNNYWRWQIGEEVTTTQFLTLLKKFIQT